MSLSDVNISSMFYIIPSDIKAAIVAVFAFLCVLAVWRIIK